MEQLQRNLAEIDATLAAENATADVAAAAAGLNRAGTGSSSSSKGRGGKKGKGSGGKGKVQGKGKPKGGRGPLDECQADEKLDYSKRMGKWATMAVRCVLENKCWVVCMVSNRISHTLDHMQWIIQKTRGQHEFANLAQLMFGKAEVVYDEIQDLVRDTSWVTLVGSVLCPGEEEDLVHKTTRLVVRVAADFKRRIIDRLRSMPAKLLWFAHCPAEEKSTKRVELARELLDTADTKLHVTALKGKRRFFRELLACAGDGGIISMRLYVVFRLLADNWVADN